MPGFLMLVMTIILIAAPAWAGGPIKVEEIVVTATRYEQPATDIPANVTVINEETIRNSTARYVPDLLRNEAGVQVTDMTGNGRSTTVDLRGFGETGSYNTLVLIDGRKVNGPDLSGVDWTQIPLDRIKRIEIVRGGRGAVLYGDNAAGGVINIITREGEKLSAGFSTAGGSYGTFKADAYVSGDVKDKLPFYLSAGSTTSSGYRDNSYTRAQDLGAKIAFYTTSSLKLVVDAGYHKDKTGMPGSLSETDLSEGTARTSTKEPDNFAKVEDYYFKTSPEISFGGDNCIKIDFSYRKRNSMSSNTYAGVSYPWEFSIKTVAVSPQIFVKSQMSKAVNSMFAGFDFQQAADDMKTASSDLKKTNYGGYIHDELALTKDLRISAGYRRDRAEYSFSPSEPSGKSYNEDAYTTGVNYTFSGRSYIYGSFAKSFRYPLLDELYDFMGSINSSLSPQTSNDYEAGLRYYFSEKTYAHLNIFKMDTNNEIFYNSSKGVNENAEGTTERIGVEVSVAAKVLEKMSLRGSYTHTDGKMNGGTYESKHIPNVPEHRATIEAVYQLNTSLALTLNGQYVGERPFISDFANDFGKQDEYFLLNARLGYEYKKVKAFFMVNNLLDKKYSEYGVIDWQPAKTFYPSPGRNFMLGVSVAL